MIKLEHCKFCCIKNLVTKFTVTLNTENIEVDVAAFFSAISSYNLFGRCSKLTSTGVCAKRKAQGIRPALRNTLWKVFLLSGDRSGYLFGI